METVLLYFICASQDVKKLLRANTKVRIDAQKN